MLETIRSPEDIRTLSQKELEALAAEIRAKILQTVSRNGGHLGSNLGFVEATLAIHTLFDLPNDKLIFDVGHQCYTHKLLTGRYDRFDTLRTSGGISGFPNRFESAYDTLTAGHSGSSVSAALGVAEANRLAGRSDYTVCVVGDGSFTNGMIYEALNNCNNKNLRLIIILNDNEMSISQNVGSLAGYLSKIRTSGMYYRFKRSLQKVLHKLPLVGDYSIRGVRHIKNGLKRMFYKQPFFAALGVRYLGPVDGNDLERLQTVLKEAKTYDTCTLVHIKTKKGCGYRYAEQTPESYHSVGAFDPNKGVSPSGKRDYSAAFGDALCALAETDERICAITAAMRDGTGLRAFSERFPTRFFDVGIAEEHEIAFAGGLAVSGRVPVCAVYSTFAQRTYDQLLHDVALQKLHIVLALDRAGFVPGDGETHQGIFDCAFLSSIPYVTLYAPDSFEELQRALACAVSGESICAVRYPRGGMTAYDRALFVPNEATDAFSVCDTYSNGTPQLALVTYGRQTEQTLKAAERLHAKGRSVRVIKLFKLLPIADYAEAFKTAVKDVPYLYFAEEGQHHDGIAQNLFCTLAEKGLTAHMRIRAVESFFPPHGSYEDTLKLCGLDEASLATDAEAFLKDGE